MLSKLKQWLEGLLGEKKYKEYRTGPQKVIRLDDEVWLYGEHPSTLARLPLAGDCGCGNCDCK